MEFLGVGPLELVFILIIALIALGPQDMVKAGKTIGKFLRQIVKSPTWHAVQQTSRDLRYLPNKLMREAGLDEEIKDLKKVSSDLNQIGKFKSSLSSDLQKTSSDINQSLSAWTTPPASPVTIESPPAPRTVEAAPPPAAQQPADQPEPPAEAPSTDAKSAAIEGESGSEETGSNKTETS